MKITTHKINGIIVTIKGNEWTADKYIGKHYAFIKKTDSKGGEDYTPKTDS